MAENRLIIRLALAGAEAVKTGVDAVRKALSGVGAAADAADRPVLGRTRAGLESISSSLNRIQALYVGVQVAQSAFFAATRITGEADAYNTLAARVRLATTGTREFHVAQAGVFQIAQSTLQPLAETGQLYTRVAVAVRGMGRSQQDALAVTEAVALGLRISGASAAESASAMLQLSQAMASGVLRGEEFAAASEAAPRLMQALADSLGVSVGALRQMAEEGKLTADVVANALTGSLAQLRAEAAQLPQTVGGAMQQVSNEFQKFLGTSEEVGGAAAVIVQGLQAIAANIPAIAGAAVIAGVAAFALVVGKVAAAMAAAAAGGGALAAVLAFLGGPIGLTIAALVALGAAAFAATRQTESAFERQVRAQAAGVAAVDATTEGLKRQTEELKKAEAALAGMERKYAELRAEAERQPANAKLQERLAGETKVIELARGQVQKLREAASAEVALRRETDAQIEALVKKRAGLVAELEKDQAEAAKKASKDAVDAQISDQKRLVDAVRAAMQTSLDEARRLSDEAAKLRQAAGEKQAARADQAAEKRLSALPPEEQQKVLTGRAETAASEADLLAAKATVAAMEGKAGESDRLAQQALKKAEEAARFADRLSDTNRGADLLESIGAIEATAIEAQAKAAEAQAAAAQAQAQAQAATLAELQQKLDALQAQAASLKVGVKTDEATAALVALDQQLEALKIKAASIVIPAGAAAAPEIPKNAAGGLIRGPGSDTSDNLLSWLSPGEFIVRAAAVRKYGVDFMRRLNTGALPRFAAGGLVSRLAIPAAASAAGAAAGAPVTFNFPAFGRFDVSASADTLAALKTAFAREALRKGRG